MNGTRTRRSNNYETTLWDLREHVGSAGARTLFTVTEASDRLLQILYGSRTIWHSYEVDTRSWKLLYRVIFIEVDASTGMLGRVRTYPRTGWTDELTIAENAARIIPDVVYGGTNHVVVRMKPRWGADSKKQRKPSRSINHRLRPPPIPSELGN
jgi:hypothetical protein